MNSGTRRSQGDTQSVWESAPSLRARDWLWRPHHAKLWWCSAATFWLIVLMVPNLPDFTDHVWTFWVMMLFHPYVILPVLGFGYLRAMFNRAWTHAEKNGNAGHGQADDGAGGFRWIEPDPMLFPKSLTDPTNPLEAGNPMNPASEAWRDRHVRGKL